MNALKTWLAGKKTYLLTAVAILTALAAFATGDLSAGQLLAAILAALAPSTVAARVSRLALDAAHPKLRS